MSDPGVEIRPLVVDRLGTLTPFPVEYARFSATHGGAPTVVPHLSGDAAEAQVLVFAEAVLLAEACNLLWRRETRNEGSGKDCRESRNAGAVVVRDLPGFCGFVHVLYADFNPEGKITDPDPESLARAAIESVGRAQAGKNGISYLIGLLEAGAETALTSRYVAEILSQTGVYDLARALRQLKTSKQVGLRNGES